MLIKYKKSLNMPRGKIIAQASHALSSFVLGCFNFEQKTFNCNIEELKKEIEHAEIKEVDDENFENSEFLIKIEDHGRTVFKGVPTITCGLSVEKNIKEKLSYLPNKFEASQEDEISTRLVHVVDKNYARKDFNKAIKECVIFQSLHLIHFMQDKDFVNSQEFNVWAKGSFAKIVLIAKDDFLNELKNKNLSLNISWDNLNSCVIGPIKKEKINNHTNSLKMM